MRPYTGVIVGAALPGAGDVIYGRTLTLCAQVAGALTMHAGADGDARPAPAGACHAPADAGYGDFGRRGADNRPLEPASGVHPQLRVGQCRSVPHRPQWPTGSSPVEHGLDQTGDAISTWRRSPSNDMLGF